MDELVKKIQALRAKIKQFNSSPKGPKVNKPKLPATRHEVPNAKAPQSQKDPVKVAEQISDADETSKKNTLKDAKQNRETMTISRDGQWSITPPK